MESPRDVVIRLRAKMRKHEQAADTWSRLYDGEQDLLFTSPEFALQTGGLFDDFADNWCQTVPDTKVERMQPMAFLFADGEPDTAAWEAWNRSQCDVEYPLAALEKLVCARSYASVWRPDGETTEITFHHTSRAIVEYEPLRRRVRRYGLTVGEMDEHEVATLFHSADGMVYRFQRNRSAGDVGEWVPRTVGLRRSEPSHFPSPMGNVVPLVEFANRGRLKGPPVSELRNVAPLQNVVNTLWVDLLTGADSAALPAQVILGARKPMRDILDDDGEVVDQEELPIAKFRRDRLLWLEQEGARIAEFSAGDLENFTKVITLAVNHIAAQTRTPPHYLLGQMVNVSADAIAAGESGLVATVREQIRADGANLRELMRLEAIASGEPGRAASLETGRVKWRDPQFRSGAQYADMLTKYKAIGIPDEALWEMIPDVDATDIERWKTMRDDQAAAIVGGNIGDLFGVKDEPVPDDGGPQPQ
ncbi:phage portal protein [Streptomyces sp. NPDC007063]|uniref:phage portal protein n=1 Tax=Streptomyces sp. NPDC007063 TaxID=3364772 RepID=UPI003682ECCC